MLKNTTLYTVTQKDVLTGGRGDLIGIALISDGRERTIPVINGRDPQEFVFDYDRQLSLRKEYYPVEILVKDGVDYYYCLGPGVREIVNLRERGLKSQIKSLEDYKKSMKSLGFWQRLKRVFKGY